MVPRVDENLLPILKHHWPQWCTAEVHTTQLAVGFSDSVVWRVQTAKGAVALRRWAPAMTASRLAAIHRILNSKAGRRLRYVARPIPTAGLDTFAESDGYLWELTPWMPGEHCRPDSKANADVQALLCTLAQWHSTFTLEHLKDEIDLLGDEESARRFLNQQPSFSRGLLRRREEWRRLRPLATRFPYCAQDPQNLGPRTCALTFQFTTCMEQMLHMADVPVRQSLCLGDAHVENVLLSGSQVSGLVDFEAICLDSPARDVARMLGSLFPWSRARWPEAIAWYDEVVKLSETERLLVSVFDVTGTMIGALRWLEWLGLGVRTLAYGSEGYSRWRFLVERLEHLQKESLRTAGDTVPIVNV